MLASEHVVPGPEEERAAILCELYREEHAACLMDEVHFLPAVVQMSASAGHLNETEVHHQTQQHFQALKWTNND